MINHRTIQRRVVRLLYTCESLLQNTPKQTSAISHQWNDMNMSKIPIEINRKLNLSY